MQKEQTHSPFLPLGNCELLSNPAIVSTEPNEDMTDYIIA